MVAISLVVINLFAFDACGTGPLFPFAILSGTVAAVLAVASVMRRCMAKMLRHMDEAFELGRQSVVVSGMRAGPRP